MDKPHILGPLEGPFRGWFIVGWEYQRPPGFITAASPAFRRIIPGSHCVKEGWSDAWDPPSQMEEPEALRIWWVGQTHFALDRQVHSFGGVDIFCKLSIFYPYLPAFRQMKAVVVVQRKHVGRVFWLGEAMILELQVLSQLRVCGTAVSKAEDKAWILLICDDQM